MSSIFSKIASGEIPSYRVAEDERHYAFLDINPLAQGHTLVIPKRQVDYIFDLEESELQELFAFTQRVAKGIKAAIPCKRVGVAVIGLEVPHAHIHLIPINSESDMDFRRPKLKLESEAMLNTAKEISSKIQF
jgi:histidine triad (HIT) family protein